MTDDIYETPSTTLNFQTELAAQLADLIPEAIADGKVDVEKLKELLDGDVADGSERFGLFWPGKKRALRAAQEPTTATLKPDFENSKDWDTTKNVFIEGDNLEVLKILQKHYHAKIKMIYIDPPYNTGKDFVYPDNYKEGLDTYLEWTRQVNEEGKKVTTNAETEGRYHSNWLNMMYPRLKLARNLLMSDGVICVSIDDHEVENLKRLMLEVFGEDNFLAQLIWDKQHSQQQGVFKRYHEYVLVFARNAVRLGGIRGGEGFIEAGALKKISRANPASEFTFPAGTRFDAPDGFELKGTYGDSEKVSVVSGRFLARNGATVEDVTLSAGWTQKNQMTSWFSGAETIDSKGQRVVEFYFNSAGKLKCRKERGMITPPSILPRYGMVSEQTSQLDALMGGHYFDTPKPVEMIKDLSRWFTAGSDTIMDFFAGSGTTGQSVMELNAEDVGTRRFVLVQLPEPLDVDTAGEREAALFCDSVGALRNVASLTKERLRRAGASASEVNPAADLDAGFKSYVLADTNFAKWRLSSDVEEDALQQHLLSLRDSATDDATADELLTEILLKQGYSLTEAVSPAEVAGLDVRLVRDRDGDIAVLAYLNEHVKPTLEQLRALVDKSPTRIIVLEDAFQGDDELKTNLAQLAKSKGIELWTA
ncbi:site-specific DNA-methyltransferase [Luteococcus sanguinis]|uniref:Site-specific DNA-methyltransferase n=1 Tax=Luteococcus sanguinis TaxID=174038 RepID=A0ABW1X159_9ACTN